MEEILIGIASLVGLALLVLPLFSLIFGLVTRSRISGLAARVGDTESEIALLRAEVMELRTALASARAQAIAVGARTPVRVAPVVVETPPSGADARAVEAEERAVARSLPAGDGTVGSVDVLGRSDGMLKPDQALGGSPQAVGAPLQADGALLQADGAPLQAAGASLQADGASLPADGAVLQADGASSGEVEPGLTGGGEGGRQESAGGATGWGWAERQLAGNWTGILGAGAVVVGTGFFGIFAALMMPPFLRFLLVLAFAGVLGIASVILGRTPAWEALARWVRSAAAAVVLVACVGGVLFTPMRWVTSDVGGVLLVSVGVAVNLAAGLLAGGEVFAALHVVLGLLAVGMLPASASTIAVAAAVAAVGQLAVWRQPRWGAQLAVTAVAFALWHVAWLLRLPVETTDAVRHGLAIGAVLLVGIGGYVTSYRRVLAEPAWDEWGFLLHLIVQGCVAGSLAQHDLGGSMATVGMAAASVGLHRASAMARRGGAAWLFRTDRLVALGLAVGAVATLHRQDVHVVYLLLGATLVAVGWVVNEARRDDRWVLGASVGLAHALGPWAMAAAMIAGSPPHHHVAALIGAAALVLAGSAFAERWQAAEREDGGPRAWLGLGVVAGWWLLGADQVAMEDLGTWAAVVPAVAVGVLVAGRRPWPTDGLEVGLAVVLVHLVAVGGWFVGTEVLSVRTHALSVVLLGGTLGAAAVSGAATRLWGRAVAGTSLAVVLGLLTWRYTVEVSSFVPGVLWVVLSLGWLELSRLDRLAAARDGMRLLGAATFVAFLVRHGLVDLQQELMVGPVSVRGAVEVYAALVAGWWVAATRHDPPGPVAWSVEAALALAALFVALEVPPAWIAPVLAVEALVLVEVGRRIAGLERLIGWAVVVNLAALVRVAVLSSRLVDPGEGWSAWTLSLVAMAVAWGTFLRGRAAAGTEVGSAWMLGPVVAVARGVTRSAGPWLLYPWFAALAVYLAWVFSHGVLTLLWMGECFGMFAAAVWLRDGLLRRVSMAAIFVVLGRLLIYDLQSSNILVKAMVFVGSGGLLIAINALYHRFRDRFEEAT